LTVLQREGQKARVLTFLCHPNCPNSVLIEVAKYEINPYIFATMETSDLTSISKEVRNNFSRKLLVDWIQTFQSRQKTLKK